MYAASYLVEAAQQFFEQYIGGNKVQSWKEFQEELRKRFRPTNYQETLYAKLSEIRQSGFLTKHIEQFTLLKNRTVEMPEHIKVSLFAKSLEEALAREVNYRKPKCLYEAIQIARDYDQCYLKTDEKQLEVNYA
jgi:hypothetical protein